MLYSLNAVAVLPYQTDSAVPTEIDTGEHYSSRGKRFKVNKPQMIKNVF